MLLKPSQPAHFYQYITIFLILKIKVDMALRFLFDLRNNTITQKGKEKVFRCMERVHFYISTWDINSDKILKKLDNSKTKTFLNKYILDLKTPKIY